MANYDENDQQTIAAFILENLPGHKQFALATTDSTGRPWVVCVNLTYDDNLCFIWKSAASTEHSKHIQARPNVSICVFSENTMRGDFGFYARGEAHEITDPDEMAAALGARYAKKGLPVPPASDFVGGSPARLYIATINEAWINDDRHIKTPVDLDILRKQAKQINSQPQPAQ